MKHLETAKLRQGSISRKFLQLSLSRSGKHSVKNSWIRIVIRISAKI